MRPLLVALSIAYLAGNALAAFLMAVVATFPFENQSSEYKDGWLLGVALVVVLLALATLVAVVVRRAHEAKGQPDSPVDQRR